MSGDDIPELQTWRDAVDHYRWRCECGQSDIPVSITEVDTVYGHCPACRTTIFWNDPEVFDPWNGRDPWDFLDERDVRTRRTTNGDLERWYPRNKVRIYELDRDGDRG